MSADTVITTLYLKFNNKAGYILIVYSSVISFALILFAGAYLSFQENQVRQLEREISSIKAFYIAQAGLKKISYLNNTELKEPFGAGSYKVTSSKEQYTSVGEVRGVKRTLKADIEKTGSNLPLGARYRDAYIEGAVYVHDDFGTINLKGLIDGKESSYALKTGDVVLSEPFNWNITFIGDVKQRKPRSDYNKIWNELWDDYKVIRFIDNNDNSNIVEHSKSNTRQWLDLGGAKYYFNIVSGEIRNPQLTVKKNKTYTLPSGTYFLIKLEVEEGAQLKVNGPVTIFLYSTQRTDELRLEEDASINKKGKSGDFTLLGFNYNLHSPNKPMIEMFKGSQLYGTILAPFYQFIIREGAKLEGALLVHNFYMWQKTQPIPPRWQIIYNNAGPGNAGSPSIIRNWKEVESE